MNKRLISILRSNVIALKDSNQCIKSCSFDYFNLQECSQCNEKIYSDLLYIIYLLEMRSGNQI